MLLLVSLLVGPGCRSSEPTLTVFAAASLQDVLPPLARGFEAKQSAPLRVEFHFAASSALVTQIRQGAPADLLITADRESYAQWGSPDCVLATNRLILAGRSQLGRDGWPERLRKLDRIALGDPTIVPAGRYAREALTRLGLWSAIEARSAPCLDVRAALALVESGGAPVAAVYATDLSVAPELVELWSFPPEACGPIEYPAGVVKSSPRLAEARALLDYLAGPEGREAFQRAGFGPPPVRSPETGPGTVPARAKASPQ